LLVTQIRIGVNGLIQGDYGDPKNRNLEILLLDGESVFHVWKAEGKPWRANPTPFAHGYKQPPALIQGDYVKGQPHKNFEALLVSNDGGLEHWTRENAKGGGKWVTGGAITYGVVGAPSLAMSHHRDQVAEYHTEEVWVEDKGAAEAAKHNVPKDLGPSGHYETRTVVEYHASDHRNFEALVPTAGGLIHWARHNTPAMNWQMHDVVTSKAGSLGCLYAGDYGDNLEALVYEPDGEHPWGTLTHFWMDTNWHRGAKLDSRALGPGALIQSDYLKNEKHKNLEALVVELDDKDQPMLRPWVRTDKGDKVGPWVAAAAPILPGLVPAPEVSLIQGDLGGNKDHGNFEALIRLQTGELVHIWRNANGFAWNVAEEPYPTGP